MTMDDFRMLTAYWADHPPAHVLASSLAGYKPGNASKPPSDLAALFGADATAKGLQAMALLKSR